MSYKVPSFTIYNKESNKCLREFTLSLKMADDSALPSIISLVEDSDKTYIQAVPHALNEEKTYKLELIVKFEGEDLVLPFKISISDSLNPAFFTTFGPLSAPVLYKTVFDLPKI